jgi:hypothetical protein
MDPLIQPIHMIHPNQPSSHPSRGSHGGATLSLPFSPPRVRSRGASPEISRQTSVISWRLAADERTTGAAAPRERERDETRRGEVASHQLHRCLEISFSSCWLLLHLHGRTTGDKFYCWEFVVSVTRTDGVGSWVGWTASHLLDPFSITLPATPTMNVVFHSLVHLLLFLWNIF